MKKSPVFAALAAVLALAGAASAAAPWAQLNLSAASADFQTSGDADGYLLRVRMPDGSVVERAFAAGETPSFSVFDRAGQTLADGAYAYELIVKPRLSASASAALAASRQSGDESALLGLRASGQLPEPRIASGSFRVLGGAFVSGGAEPPTEGHSLATRTTFTDSLCVGFDCLANESFGSDTIRLKENNLRIHFDDTSTTAGFPNRDWRIQANDENSGGANKFSIQDATGSLVPFTIEAGAANNALFVDSTSRIGLRTAAPVLDLHISTGNTPAIRLEQTAASGFTAQTWDIAGNEANFFVRDVTSGSRLPLRIRPGAPSSSLDINADGNISIGTASADDRLHVATFSGTNGGVLIRSSSTGGELPQLTLDNLGAGQIWRFRVNAADQFVFTDATNGKSPVVVFANANSNLLRVGGTNLDAADVDRVTVAGELFINGTVVTPDYVFEPEYELPTIDQQLAFMRANKHLPAVGGAVQEADGTWSVNVGARQQGVLEELEKAHLYIAQLHERLAKLEATIGRD